MTEEPSPTTNPTNTAIDSFIHHAREEKKKTESVSNHPILEPEERARRTAVVGTIVGVTASLVFALVSQCLNIILLPGVLLFPSILDPFVNILVITIFGVIFSLVSVASLKIQNRVIIVALILMVLFVLYRLYQAYGNVVRAVADSVVFWFLFFIPIILVFLCMIPFGMLVRWATNAQIRYFYLPVAHWRRCVPPILLLIVMILVGMLFAFSGPEQKAIRTMNALTKEAQMTQTDKALPDVVRNIWGTPFHPYAKGAYYIIAQHNPIPERYNTNGKLYTMDIYVSAQFQSGYWFTCRFSPAGLPLQCSSDYEPPYPSGNAKIRKIFYQQADLLHWNRIGSADKLHLLSN